MQRPVMTVMRFIDDFAEMYRHPYREGIFRKS